MPAPALTPRAVALTHFYAALGAGLASGDLVLAAVAHEAIGRLLTSAQPSDGAPVVDLAAERRKRGER